MEEAAQGQVLRFEDLKRFASAAFDEEIGDSDPRLLRARAPHAYPNPLMVRLADEALQRSGRMISAAEAIGRGTIVAEGERVKLPLLLPTP